MWCSFTPSPPPPLHKTTLVLDFVCLWLFCYSFPSLCKYHSLSTGFILIHFFFLFVLQSAFTILIVFLSQLSQWSSLTWIETFVSFHRFLLVCFFLIFIFYFVPQDSFFSLLSLSYLPFVFFFIFLFFFFSFYISPFFLRFLPIILSVVFSFCLLFCLVICEWIPLLTFNPRSSRGLNPNPCCPPSNWDWLTRFFLILFPNLFVVTKPSLKCKSMKSWKSKL